MNAIFVAVSSRPHLLLLAFILLLYAAFATRSYYWDGVLFALNIESVAQGHASPAMLIHPNHLLYSAFGYVLYRAALFCGLTLRAITVLQIFNMLASTAAAALLYWIARRITQSAATALFCLTLFACGATWWKFSTDADAYVVTVLLLLLAIYLVLQEQPRVLAAALCHIAAMLFHQLAIFTYPAVLAAILLDDRQAKQKRIWLSGAYIFGTAASVGAAYWICYSQADHAAYPSLAKFVASYASDSGFTRSPGEIVTAYLASYSKLFVGGKPGLIKEYFSVASALAFALCATALGFAMAHWRGATAKPQRNRRALTVVWAWLLPYALFLACWDPGSAFHKLFVWPPMVLLLGVYVAWRRATPSIAIAIAIAAWNFGAFIYPHAHASADPVLLLAQRIDREMPKQATVYYRAFSPDDWYLDYFAPGRTWLKLNETPAAGPFCLDTTALTAAANRGGAAQHWELVNSQHNIRLECFSPAR